MMLILTSFKKSWASLTQQHLLNQGENSEEWFDGEVAEKISVPDKLFKKLKKSKLHVDKEMYKIARY